MLSKGHNQATRETFVWWVASVEDGQLVTLTRRMLSRVPVASALKVGGGDLLQVEAESCGHGRDVPQEVAQLLA